MTPKILQTEDNYHAALEQVETLMDAAPDSPEEQELELWALLIEDYESKHHPVLPPDPIEAIRFRMDQLGLKSKDLTAYIPSKSRVSEILNYKRPLSLNMIRALQAGLGIPAKILIQESPATYQIKSRKTYKIPQNTKEIIITQEPRKDMTPKILQTEDDYYKAIACLELLIDAAPGSPEELELQLWALLIKDYESRHYPMTSLNPDETIQTNSQEPRTKHK